MKVYFASALGFAESTHAYLERVVALLQSQGNEVFNPWTQPEGQRIRDSLRLEDYSERLHALSEANRAVAEANERAIRSCDWVLAILDGADVDSGTASEVGFAYGIGKRIIGLRTDSRRSGDNDAAIVNLQVQHWVEASGGTIFRSLDELRQALSTRSWPA
jgi:nucleoside 2-deoxyribosyltransferase